MNVTGWDCLNSSPMKIGVLPGHWQLLQIATVITGEGLAKPYRKYSHYSRHENYRSRCPFVAAAPGDSLAPPQSQLSLLNSAAWRIHQLRRGGRSCYSDMVTTWNHGMDQVLTSFKLRLSVKNKDIWLQATLALSWFYKYWEQLQALSWSVIVCAV